MSNKNMDIKTILYIEYIEFVSNPALYFSDITQSAVSIIDSEFDNYDKQKVLKRLKFVRTFIKNLEKLSNKNIDKILKEGGKEKHSLFLLLYSKIAIFMDLINTTVFEGSSGFNLKTKQKIPFIQCVSSNLLMVCDFSIGFLEKFNPNLTDNEKGNLIRIVGNELVQKNPDDFSTEFKDFIAKDSNPAENLYS